MLRLTTLDPTFWDGKPEVAADTPADATAIKDFQLFNSNLEYGLVSYAKKTGGGLEVLAFLYNKANKLANKSSVLPLADWAVKKRGNTDLTIFDNYKVIPYQASVTEAMFVYLSSEGILTMYQLVRTTELSALTKVEFVLDRTSEDIPALKALANKNS
jgi:hypothetical protein